MSPQKELNKLTEIGMNAINKAELKSLNFPDGSMMVRAGQLPWTPWAMPGTQFKLLYINRAIQMTVLLLKVDPGTVASVHRHFGDAHAFILDGGFGYEHGQVFEGDYIVEAGGITHQPITGDEGVTMFAFFFGGLGGIAEDGSLAGVLDCDWHLEVARGNNAAHLLT
jgi:2,4'-dihydroxyacetophenone dioxygenase